MNASKPTFCPHIVDGVAAMTITELLDNPRTLAKWLGYDPDEITEYRKPGYYRNGYTTVEKTGVQHAVEWWDNYRRELQSEFVAKNRRKTWDNFIRECIRQGAGVKGTTAAMRQQAIAARPDLFTPIESGKTANPVEFT